MCHSLSLGCSLETIRITDGSSWPRTGLKTVEPIIGTALGVGYGDDLDFAG